MYALERLTAPKPEWEYAIIYAKGVQPFTIEARDQANIRWIRAESMIEIKVMGIGNPFDPPQPPYQGEGGIPMPAYPGTLVDFTDYVHVDEICRISFFFNTRIKENANLPRKSGILTAEGENQEIAKEREALEEKKEKKAKTKSDMKSV